MKCSPHIIHRFTGLGGKKRLRDAFCSQFLVGSDLEIAKVLAGHSTLHALKPNYDLISQGDADYDIYFILCGCVSIIVNGREVARRKAGEHVGEMAVIDTTALRSATVKTLEPTVVAKVTEQDFTRTAFKYPELWRRVAVSVAQRLRERNKFHPVPRSKPAIFIGSSSEGLTVAKTIHRSLSRSPLVPYLWSKGVFECSKTTIEELMRMSKETDFAIIVLSPDDVTKSRGRRRASPRDNVIFELGLFMGALSRERTYILAPKNLDIKIPSDLLGLTLLTYQPNKNNSSAKGLKPILVELRTQIKKYGPL